MIEVRLVTGCVQYETSMEGATPTTVGVHKKNNPDYVKINSSEEFDGERDG